MGDYFWVIGHFLVGKVQRSELSVGKTISGIARSKFQWRRGARIIFGYMQYFIYCFRGDGEKSFY